jgi:hypothetical protein
VGVEGHSNRACKIVADLLSCILQATTLNKSFYNKGRILRICWFCFEKIPYDSISFLYDHNYSSFHVIPLTFCTWPMLVSFFNFTAIIMGAGDHEESHSLVKITVLCGLQGKLFFGSSVSFATWIHDEMTNSWDLSSTWKRILKRHSQLGLENITELSQ